MNTMINPEYAELRREVDAHAREIAELRGNVQQLDKLASSTNRQSTLQIAAIVISLCLTIGGGLYFQTNAIDRRIEQLEKRLDERGNQLEKRMERIERSLDELNQELRTQRRGK